jgi:hypothetical protein
MIDQEQKLAFESEYHQKENEILVLTSDKSGGAARGGGETLWMAQMFFLAYVDIATNELKSGEGRIVWPMTDEEQKEHGYLHRFKKGCIYRLRVRELIDKTVPDGMLPSFFNRFLLVETLEESAHNDALLAILEEYRKPVVISDPILGEYKLNKDLNLFDGYLVWLDKKIHVLLEVRADSKATWTKAIKILKTLFDEQKKRDAEFRRFAAEKLTGLANDWAEDGTDPIKKKDFINRISLSELAVTSGGSFTAYYHDDDMFHGHAVTVSGSIKKGLQSANIEG